MWVKGFCYFLISKSVWYLSTLCRIKVQACRCTEPFRKVCKIDHFTILLQQVTEIANIYAETQNSFHTSLFKWGTLLWLQCYAFLNSNLLLALTVSGSTFWKLFSQNHQCAWHAKHTRTILAAKRVSESQKDSLNKWKILGQQTIWSTAWERCSNFCQLIVILSFIQNYVQNTHIHFHSKTTRHRFL